MFSSRNVSHNSRQNATAQRLNSGVVHIIPPSLKRFDYLSQKAAVVDIPISQFEL